MYIIRYISVCTISEKDLDWVLETGRYQPLPIKTIPKKQRIGVVNGLAVYGSGTRGMLLTLEAFIQGIFLFDSL